MNIEQFREYCIAKPGVTEDFPFGDDTLVFRVGGKIFVFVLLDLPGVSANLKCDPEKAVRLREQYPEAVTPGYHMNKTHWNTVQLSLTADRLIKEWADHSYDLVAAKLPGKIRKDPADIPNDLYG